MTDEVETMPAGDGGGPLGPLDMDTAVSRIMALDEPEPQPEPVEDQATEDPVSDLRDEDTAAAEDDDEGEDNEGADDAETPEGDEETPEEDQEDAEPETASVNLDDLKGEFKIRRRDGTEVTSTDVKKNWDRLVHIDTAEQNLRQHVQQFQNAQTEFRQRAEQFMQTAPVAVQVLKDSMPEVPPMPPRELIDQDWDSYQRQMDAHTRAKTEWQDKSNKIQSIVQEYQRQQAANAQTAEEQARQSRTYHQQKLFEKMPDLRDQSKFNSFFNEFYAYAEREFGLTPQELNTVHHHGIHVMASKAMAYDKLMSEKPKAVKKEVVKAPPKQQPGKPGKRPTKEEATAQKRADWKARVHKKGGLGKDDAVRLLLERDL